MHNPKIKETTNGDTRGYFMPAALVNKLIGAIMTGVVVIAGYMVVWAVNDARWKAEQQAKVDLMTTTQSIHLRNHPDMTGQFDRRITVLETNQNTILNNQQTIMRGIREQK